jgi:hypothetical protein
VRAFGSGNSINALTITCLARYKARCFSCKEVDVTTRTAPFRKMGACTAAVALGVLCTAPPCAAGEPVPVPARAPSAPLAALSTASQALLARADQGTTTSNSPRFFKTGKGAAVLALFGAGFGIALYSKVHDRVQSPVR